MRESKKQSSLSKKRIRGLDVNVRWLTFAITLFVGSTACGQEFRSGKSFRATLEQKITGAIQRSPLRSAIKKLALDAGVSVVVDRRVDPTQLISVQLEDVSLRDALRQVAVKAGAISCELDNVIFIGPQRTTRKLRTLVHLRRKETEKLPNRRTLRGAKTHAWQMLAEPRGLLTRISGEYGVRPDESVQIPHDLWAAGAMPRVDAATALSIVLIQFGEEGQTLEWSGEGKTFKVVAAPKDVAIEARIRISRNAGDDILRTAKERYPQAKITKSRGYLEVRGTVEEIDAIKVLARGSK